MVSYKTKHIITMLSSNRAPGYLPKGVENLCPHKNLHTDVYGSFVHNCPNLKQPRCPPVDEWIQCGMSTQWNIVQH